jgi:hypothetical protein
MIQYITENYTLSDGRFFRKTNGKEIGCWNVGYRYATVLGRAYPVHHLVWLLNHGELPPDGYDIDHKDMDRSNNNVDNLRLATRSQNMLNMCCHKDSKTGIKGVSWRSDTKKWTVRVTVDGAYKSFGSYDDLELAELVAQEAREKYHGDFVRHE